MTKNLLDLSHTVRPARFLLSHSVKRGLKSCKDEGKRRKHRGRRNNTRWREAKMKGGRQKGGNWKALHRRWRRQDGGWGAEQQRAGGDTAFNRSVINITKSLRDHTHTHTHTGRFWNMHKGKDTNTLQTREPDGISTSSNVHVYMPRAARSADTSCKCPCWISVL